MCDLCVTFVQHFIGVLRVLDIMFCQIKSKNSSVYKPGIFSLARLKLLEKNNVFWREDVFWTDEGPEWPPYSNPSEVGLFFLNDVKKKKK